MWPAGRCRSARGARASFASRRWREGPNLKRTIVSAPTLLAGCPSHRGIHHAAPPRSHNPRAHGSCRPPETLQGPPFFSPLENRSYLIVYLQDRGLRANMKSDVLINLLLRTNKPETAKPTSTSRLPQRISSTRTVSRPASTRGRVGSMIIHDIPDDVEMDDDGDTPKPNGVAPPTSSIPGPASRTRKAKEVQAKVGLGRPRLLGGTGPRTVSRKPSSAPERRTRAVTSVQPSEAAIREEDEEGNCHLQGFLCPILEHEHNETELPC